MIWPLDTLILKALPSAPNYIGLQDEKTISNRVMRFQRNHSFLRAALGDISNSVDGQNWFSNGPMFLTKSMKIFCNKTNLTEIVTNGCSDISAFQSNAFYPRTWHQWKENLKDNLNFSLEKSYTAQLWNPYSGPLEEESYTSVVTSIATENCPLISTYILEDKLAENTENLKLLIEKYSF